MLKRCLLLLLSILGTTATSAEPLRIVCVDEKDPSGLRIHGIQWFHSESRPASPAHTEFAIVSWRDDHDEQFHRLRPDEYQIRPGESEGTWYFTSDFRDIDCICDEDTSSSGTGGSTISN